MWQAGIMDESTLRDVPKVRVNPPDLGSLDPFVSASIAPIREGMAEYFLSSIGKRAMGELVHMTYAKLWCVHHDMVIQAGSTGQPFRIAMRDVRCDFAEMSPEELVRLIEAREPGVHVVDIHALTQAGLQKLHERAKRVFEKTPVVPTLSGHFAYVFDGEEYDLAANERVFHLARSEGGTPSLNVLWRSEEYGDFAIAGFPKSVRVRSSDSCDHRDSRL